MDPAIGLGTGSLLTSAHPWCVFVNELDIVSSTEAPSLVVEMTGPGSNGSATIVVVDASSTASVSRGDQVRILRTSDNETVFGGLVEGVSYRPWAAVGRTLTIRATGWGAMLDGTVLPGPLVPGANGSAVGTCVQSIVAGAGGPFTASGYDGVGIDPDTGRTVEVDATSAQVTTVPTIQDTTLRAAISTVTGLAVSSSGGSTTSTTATRSLLVSADSLLCLLSGATNTGGGKDQHLPVGAWTGGSSTIFRAVLKFGLNWTDVGQIVSAKLKVRTTTQVHTGFGSATTASLYVDRITATWTEGTAKAVAEGGSGWSSSDATVYPGPSVTTAERATMSVGNSENAWITTDITDIVEQWAPATVLTRAGTAGAAASNYGLRIISSNEAATTNTREFYSRESSYDPYIVLTYTTGSTATTTDLPSGSLLVYTDSLARIYCHTSDLYAGNAPYKITSAPSATDEIAPSDLEYSSDAGTTDAVWVRGASSTSSGWVTGPSVRIARQSVVSDSGLTTESERDAAGRSALSDGAGGDSLVVTVVGYDGWRPGQLVQVTYPSILGTDPVTFRIVNVTMTTRPANVVPDYVIATYRLSLTAPRRLWTRSVRLTGR